MRYMGSKRRVANDLLPRLLAGRRVGDAYIEPFCGGCNVIDKVDGRRVANDANPYLIAMWQELVRGWVPQRVAEGPYFDMRADREAYPPHEVGWAGFACSWRGKWFDGYARSSGGRDYQRELGENILRQVPALRGVDFTAGDYTLVDAPSGSVVYCDPPYRETRGYSHGVEYDAFWEWARGIARSSAVFVSEYVAPDDWRCIWEKPVRSSLSVNGETGWFKDATERLFVWRGAELA